MRMLIGLGKLGIGVISSTKAPACAGARCISTIQAATEAPVPCEKPSIAAESPHIISPGPCTQSLSGLQNGFQGPQDLTILKEALQQPVPEPLLFRYQFREPLIEGVILQKRKRFTVDVAVNGELIVCHCPTTCLSLYQTLLDGQQVRCLLSRADPAVKRTKARETQHSVEAISLDGAQSWIGINQCHVTRYIGHYLRAGGLPSICADPTGLRAEQMVGRRRIDFVYEGRDSIEVKMPPPRHMREAALRARVGGRPYSERMLGQVVCMTQWMQEQRAELGFSDKAWLRNRQMREQPGLKDPRAILLLAYQHREPPMSLPKRITREPSPLMEAMRTAIMSGLEIWQVNMDLDKHGVALRSYFPRRLLRGRPHHHLAMRKGHDYTLDASCALPTPALITDSGSSGGGSLVLQQPQHGMLTEPNMLWQLDQSLTAARGAVEDTSEAAALQTAVHDDAEWLEGHSAGTVRVEHEEEELLAVTA